MNYENKIAQLRALCNVLQVALEHPSDTVSEPTSTTILIMAQRLITDLEISIMVDLSELEDNK